MLRKQRVYIIRNKYKKEKCKKAKEPSSHIQSSHFAVIRHFLSADDPENLKNPESYQADCKKQISSLINISLGNHSSYGSQCCSLCPETKKHFPGNQKHKTAAEPLNHRHKKLPDGFYTACSYGTGSRQTAGYRT